jgi:hypothetical protein
MAVIIQSIFYALAITGCIALLVIERKRKKQK